MPDLSPITIEATIQAPVSKVWTCWTTPEHIMRWNAASYDWHCPSATTDLKPGGRFTARMEARDGSMGFDFEGIYDEVLEHSLITYHMTGDDSRQVKVEFISEGGTTLVKETFTPESTHSLEMQRAGWQSILDRFKAHVEEEA